jgi:hypothetical protein
MSGGTFYCSPWLLKDFLKEVSEVVKKDSVKLSNVFEELSEVLFEAIHEIDYHYAADSEIENFEEFTEKFCNSVSEAINK